MHLRDNLIGGESSPGGVLGILLCRLAATFLELAYGSKEEANKALPWLLFFLGMAYERHHLNLPLLRRWTGVHLLR